jgi:cytochrome c biogenesis protein CcdA
MITFPILITLYAGFTHAFEADHLLAVGNIVTRRNQVKLSLKDGFFWGLGHTSTILLVGMLMLGLKMNITTEHFSYFEAGVGVMLIVLGLVRLWRHYTMGSVLTHTHGKAGLHSHGLAYSVGLVHGLAGSGVLMVMVMSEMERLSDGLMYLLVFGAGSVAGMSMAAGLFNVPFSKRIMQWKGLHVWLLLVSCLLCIVYGAKVVAENLG